MSFTIASTGASALRFARRFRSIEERIGLTAFAAALLLFSAQSAFAHEFKIGSIEIEHPWTRATPPGAAVGGGYVEITNDGDTADRLVSATADIAGRVEIHEMKVEDGVMKMAPLPDGVPIPAKETVKLAPGGYHIMFMQLKGPLKKGDKIPGTLTFEKAGTVKVEFAVEAIGAKAPEEAGHDDTMPGMDMSK
ncbi:hypothetical protein C3941_04645 [Kaistia algarum]|uniref:copper chaperone PCu(A)C n=1 Tax=Kaistia algarum TaxID=2083279 RepID=UPI000CE728C2|nr:copper chaperone PCu(A)C [Kaistia algarum]MCX5512494.1 copper chaperone PCu(A)C [Kaistia algarum]PPE81969.1 hypothetical protein C3941_04645 [Kaistia algarum]